MNIICFYKSFSEENKYEFLETAKLNFMQGNISCKDGFGKGQKWYGPNRSRRY